MVGEVLLSAAALVGAACIVLTIFAFAGGYSLVMFKTGSMSPTIPAGSVALVQKISADEISVGDVLTVDREGALPVTHRVRSVAPGPSSELRVIEMQGDANATPDPAPYTISEARIVIGSVPHVAHVIVWFGSPWVMGGITIAAAVLVTWAFWPRGPGRSAPGRHSASRPRHAASALGISVGVMIGGALPAVDAVPAMAAKDALVLRSNIGGLGSMKGEHYVLDADIPLHWHIDADASRAPEDGELRVSISASGDSALGVRAEVRSCDEAWNAARCPGEEHVLHETSMLSLEPAATELVRTATPGEAHLRISLTAHPEAAADGSEQVRATVRATASGEQHETSISGVRSEPLSTTGSWHSALFAAPAAVLIGLGIALFARVAQRYASRGDERR